MERQETLIVYIPFLEERAGCQMIIEYMIFM